MALALHLLLVWRWAVLAVGRSGDEVSIVKLLGSLPVSVRSNSDYMVGPAEEGEALLVELWWAGSRRE